MEAFLERPAKCGRRLVAGCQRLDGQGRVQVLLDVEEYGVEPLTMKEDRLLTRLHCLWGHQAASIAESERANYPILALSACGVFTSYEFVFVFMGRYRLRPIQRRNFDADHSSYTLCR